ncbi:uncharacterized protein LOC116181208 isoform X1 [Photinus pyralis]|uniref:uncharacterized protein LOC116181208 isoform X1 n=1 Tax=Photinus pyralis TaxID=7054 RepID=UPI00126706FD|nr:uncharacterized protein LOC116181208 isoform X1 [Photinus pyralis]
MNFKIIVALCCHIVYVQTDVAAGQNGYLPPQKPGYPGKPPQFPTQRPPILPPFQPGPSTKPPFGPPSQPPTYGPPKQPPPTYGPPFQPTSPPYRPPVGPPTQRPPFTPSKPGTQYLPPSIPTPRPTGPSFKPGPGPIPEYNGNGIGDDHHGHHDHHHHHEPGMPFDFNYAVVEPEYGNDYSHNAISDGDVTKGEYQVLLPDGRKQITKYTADWATGFHAQSPPKYEYGYMVLHGDGGVGQGKTEAGVGAVASGRYYVEGKNSSQEVEYVADDGGYHPYVEYNNRGPHSRTVAHMAMDKAAINTLNHKRGQHVKVAPEEHYKQNVEDDTRPVVLENLYDQSVVASDQERARPDTPAPVQTRQYGDYDQPQQYVYLTYPTQEPNEPPQQQQVYVDQPQTLQTLQQYLQFPYLDNTHQTLIHASDNFLGPPLLYEVPSIFPPLHQQESYTNNYDQSPTKSSSYRFLDNFKHLVSDQDIVDINHQSSPSADTPSVAEKLVRPEKQNDHRVFSDQPIVVADFRKEPPPTTHPPPRTEGGTTVVVTPRPIQAALLAPLTAGVELPVPPQEKRVNIVHENYVVDVQPSIPYYLGKIEYYNGDGDGKSNNVTATATQHLKLGDFLQRPIIDRPKRPTLAQALGREAQKPSTAQEPQESKYHQKVAQVPVPVPVKVVDSPRPQYNIPKPYPVPVPIVQTFYLPIEPPKLYPPLEPNFKRKPKNLAAAASVQSNSRVPCVNVRLFGVSKPICDNYIGLVPPKVQAPQVYFNATRSGERKQRTAREDFESKIRWEYGFRPPLIPSMAIDEDGNPIEKHTR